MDAAYIEALNTGFLRERATKGEVRDPLLLDEIDRLNETVPPTETVTNEPCNPGAQATTTIPPPSWKRD